MKKIILICLLAIAFKIAEAQPTVGLIEKTQGNLNGYVLFAPMPSKTTYLINKCGNVVNTWDSDYTPAFSCYLLETGEMLRPGYIDNSNFVGGVRGGIIEKFNWEGTRTWSYTLSTDSIYQDHDIYPLPNGNILALVLSTKTEAEAVQKGRNPNLIQNIMWDTKIMELRPVGEDSAEIVWLWSAFDHLIQNFDATKDNYGTVSEHPELININYRGQPTSPDWLHINSVAYNQRLNQIVLSVNNFSEFWIIDHSTTTAEAATHTGGASGKGGDLLHRWGNPEAYGRGIMADQKIFNLHNAHWIDEGFPGEGEILLFNNGNQRPEGSFSSVDSYTLPHNNDSTNYLINGNEPFLPLTPSWTYTAPTPSDFYSLILAGVQRLSNGNTLICEAIKGNFFEIDSANNIVWKYISPIDMNGPASQGQTISNNYVFRCTLYEPNYPAFSGRTLNAAPPIELNPITYLCDVNSVSSVNDRVTINVFPNPFNDKLLIRFGNKPINIAALSIYDYTGKVVFKKENIFTEEISIDKTELPANGIYLYTIQSSSFNTSGKFILQ